MPKSNEIDFIQKKQIEFQRVLIKRKEISFFYPLETLNERKISENIQPTFEWANKLTKICFSSFPFMLLSISYFNLLQNIRNSLNLISNFQFYQNLGRI